MFLGDCRVGGSSKANQGKPSLVFEAQGKLLLNEHSSHPAPMSSGGEKNNVIFKIKQQPQDCVVPEATADQTFPP